MNSTWFISKALLGESLKLGSRLGFIFMPFQRCTRKQGTVVLSAYLLVPYLLRYREVGHSLFGECTSPVKLLQIDLKQEVLRVLCPGGIMESIEEGMLAKFVRCESPASMR